MKSKKRVLHSERLTKIKRSRRKIFAKKFFLLFFLIVAALIGFIFLFRWNESNISDIQISGNKVVETKSVEEIVRQDLSGDYLWILPKTNFLFYPARKIKSDLMQKLKRIENISLSVENIKTLKINLSERSPLYTYCGEILADSGNGQEKCYFMDGSGYIFDEAPYFSGNVYLKFYGKTNEAGIDPLGYYYFGSNFDKLIAFKDNLVKLGLSPAIFNVLDNGDMEVYLASRIKSQLGPKIIFKSDADLDQITENLQSVLSTEPFQSDFNKKYDSLLYIDLRFGNKVYYKFK